MVNEGVDILDVGACSTRPGAQLISQEDELMRLRLALHLIRKRWPTLPISVDTFRADVAKLVVEEHNVGMINDVSGGKMDENMFRTVAELKVPYVLMHMKGLPATMQVEPVYEDLITEIAQYFSDKVFQLRALGVNDILLDPGFGFGKSLDHNYQLLRRLNDFELFDLPILIGVSRKSMIYKKLDVNPENALNGTTVLNTLALMGGAGILRVHDVREAKECVELVQNCKNAGLCS